MSVELRYPQASAEVREAAQSGPVEDSLGRLTKSRNDDMGGIEEKGQRIYNRRRQRKK